MNGEFLYSLGFIILCDSLKLVISLDNTNNQMSTYWLLSGA